MVVIGKMHRSPGQSENMGQPKTGSVLPHMDVQLGEREGNSVLGEFLVDAFVEPVSDFLVVLSQHPDPELEFNGAVAQFVQIHLRLLGSGVFSSRILGCPVTISRRMDRTWSTSVP